MGKVDESIVKISRDPRCLLTFIAHQPYDLYGKHSESFAFSIHEDALRALVSEESWALLDTGGELHFKLVEVEWVNELEQFIKNGVEFGYITIPEEGDPARDIIDEIIGDK